MEASKREVVALLNNKNLFHNDLEVIQKMLDIVGPTLSSHQDQYEALKLSLNFELIEDIPFTDQDREVNKSHFEYLSEIGHIYLHKLKRRVTACRDFFYDVLHKGSSLSEDKIIILKYYFDFIKA